MEAYRRRVCDFQPQTEGRSSQTASPEKALSPLRCVKSNKELGTEGCLVPQDIPAPFYLFISVILFPLLGMRILAPPTFPGSGEDYILPRTSSRFPSSGKVCHGALSYPLQYPPSFAVSSAPCLCLLLGSDPFRVGTVSFLYVSVSTPLLSICRSSAFLTHDSATGHETAELNG